jgi:Reverse transcriptase (RNA-dependent DNA polymerase)
MDDQFPMHLWHKTIPQAELTLNLLRGSRINPKLSAWEQLHGRYDFNRTPIAPPGIKVLAHERPEQRKSWSAHAKEGWYVGPALDHYRCYRVWIISTRQERVVNSLTWFPQKLAMPIATAEDLMIAAINDLRNALVAPPTHSLIGNLPPSETEKLDTLANILHQEVQHPSIEKAKKPAPAPSLRVEPLPTTRRSDRPSIPPERYSPGTTHVATQPDEPDADTTFHAHTATHPDTGLQAEYKDLVKSSAGPRWEIAMCKEIGRLFQGYDCPDGVHDTKGTNTVRFIKRKDIPAGKKPTYVRIVTAYRENKEDPYRVRMTVGGNLIDFPGDVATKTADLTTAKLLINSIISNPKGRAMCIDIKDFYLNNDLPNTEYIRIPVSIIPAAIWKQYKVDDYVDDGYVYGAVDKGMYGLPQAGRVASDVLIPRLKAKGYIPSGRTPGLFKHTERPIQFALVVDDFFVSLEDDQDGEHLINSLQEHYQITVDKTASKFCGMQLDWDYNARHVDVSMPKYIEKTLQRFEHPKPKRPQHAPSKWNAPTYGATVQYAEPEDTSPPLAPAAVTRLQQIIGTLLYYARAVDSTMLVALGTIAAAQTKATDATMQAAMQLLDYAATHPDAKVRFHASDMILHIHSDASYLSEPQARSRVGGYFFLGGKEEPADNPRPNGPVHVESRIMRNVMASAAEAETGGLFINGQEGTHIRQILAELGHPQPGPTPITTDNSTADGFANDRTKIKRSKAMDMRFYWIKDRVGQGEFDVRWAKGKVNLGDYYTKHHPPSHHIQMRPTYLHTDSTPISTAPECKGVLIRDSGLTESQSCQDTPEQCGTAIAFTVASSTTDEHEWTVVARRARRRPTSGATVFPENRSTFAIASAKAHY